MEKRKRQLEQIERKTSQFLEGNPEIAKALKLFDVSFEQYRMATEATNFSTDASTNPGANGIYKSNAKKVR